MMKVTKPNQIRPTPTKSDQHVANSGDMPIYISQHLWKRSRRPKLGTVRVNTSRCIVNRNSRQQIFARETESGFCADPGQIFPNFPGHTGKICNMVFVLRLPHAKIALNVGMMWIENTYRVFIHVCRWLIDEVSNYYNSFHPFLV